MPIHPRRSTPANSHGALIRWVGLYDALVQVVTLGGERRLRCATLDQAGISPGGRVLDVGCGTGSLTREAKRRAGPGGTVAGVDASPEMIGQARRKAEGAGLRMELAIASATSLPFIDASFDVVLCSLALHHLRRQHRGEAVREMHRVLAPGGRLLILELAPDSGWRAALNPIALLHRRSGDIAAEAEALLTAEGFAGVSSGRIGVRNLKYVLGTRPVAGGDANEGPPERGRPSVPDDPVESVGGA